MISAHGSTSAQGIIIADGCSETDLQSGHVLSDYAGDLLNSLCRETHIDYNGLWKTALIKDRINLKDWKENVKLVTDEYRGILQEEIRTIKPNVLLPIGELAFNYATGLNGIRKFRGSVLPSRADLGQFKVIPILGPNPYLNEDYKLRFISKLDLSKVSKNLNSSEPPKEVGQVWVAKTGSQVREFFTRHYAKAKFVVFDIETFADLPTCISFCFDGWESMCVPIIDKSISMDDRVLMLHEVCKLLASPLQKVNQNIKFDWKKLDRLGIKVDNVGGDTMLAAALLYCEFPKNLGFLTSIYTDMPYFKDEGKEYDPAVYNREKLYIYNAKDSLSTHQIMTQQLVEMKEQGVEKVYENLIQILPIYKRMEQVGIRIDVEAQDKLLAKYTSLYEINLYKLHKLVGEPINPLSSIRVNKLVYEELGFKKLRGIKQNKSGTLKADEDALELLMWMGNYESTLDGKAILRCIIDCRKLHKVLEVLVLPLHPDNRMRCEFNLAGAETGRTTAGETTDYFIRFDKNKIKLTNLGHSFQTFGKHGFTVEGVTYGKDLRSIFTPDRGYSFVECDLSQAEARVDAVLSCDFDILNVFDGPIGIHKLTGSWVYNCEPHEIKKNTLTLNESGVGEDRYLIAKTVRHAGERNMREDRLMMMVHKPILECAKILKTFHNKQPNIREVFHREIREHIEKYRLLVAPNGRRRDFFGRPDNHTINEGISFLPQAIVTDYLKQALPKNFSVADYAIPLSEAHDGFLSMVPNGREEEFGKLFKTTVEVPIDFRTCSLQRDFMLTIPMEVAMSSENWKELREIKI